VWIREDPGGDPGGIGNPDMGCDCIDRAAPGRAVCQRPGQVKRGAHKRTLYDEGPDEDQGSKL